MKTESLPDKWDRVANTLEAKRFAGIDDSPEEKWTDTFLGGCATRARQDAMELREAMRWVPVTERLPECEPDEDSSAFVLVVAPDGQRLVAFYNYEIKAWLVGDIGRRVPATHWTHLQEAP